MPERSSKGPRSGPVKPPRKARFIPPDPAKRPAGYLPPKPTPADPTRRTLKFKPRKGPNAEPAPADIEPSGPRETWLPGAIRIVHEDEHLIVVDKPAGMLSVTTPEHPAANVFDEVKAHVRDRARKRGTRVWVIHRLDKEASGLLVFAKTERAFHFVKEEFRARRVHRLYAAVVEGELRPEPPTAPDAPEETEPSRRRRMATEQAHSGTIQSFLYEDARGLVHTCDSPSQAPRGAQEPDGDDMPARLAVTHWQAQRVGSGRTLLQVRLETGRKHQIRAHLASIRRPIVGDHRYGAATDPLGRVCLHAFELGIAHPSAGETMRFRSPTPGSFFGLVGEKREERGVRELRAAAEDAAQAALPPPVATPPKSRTSPTAAPAQSSWDHVADWYDDLLEGRGSDHHERVILPGAMRLLGAKRGQRVLDVACGQGILCRRLGAMGVRCVGLDSSERLVEAAKRAGGDGLEFVVGDARNPGRAVQGPFDAAACVMALMNIDPVSSVLKGAAELLKPGGAFVAVILHPAFRAPGQTSWGWENQPPGQRQTGSKPAARVQGGPPPADVRQYRRVDGYLSPGQREIVMNPGSAAHGKSAVTTLTYHRPIEHYARAFAGAGLLLDALEEWSSLRVSQPGPRAAEENRARREIPMFLALRGVKVSPTAPRE